MDRLCFSYPYSYSYSIEQVTLESSASSSMSRSILAVMLVLSAGLHLLFIVLAPAPTESKDVDRPQRVLKLRMVSKAVVPEVLQEQNVAAHSVESKPARVQVASKPKQQPQETIPLITESKAARSITEMLRQTLIEPQISDSGIRCTPLQRRQHLINCDDSHRYSDIGAVTGTELSQSLDSTLRVGVQGSEWAMALQVRQLLYQNEELQRQQVKAVSAEITADSGFLQAQLAENLRQLRRQSDALDRERSSLNVLGMTIDTYRASDSDTRNPNVFNRGRL